MIAVVGHPSWCLYIASLERLCYRSGGRIDQNHSIQVVYREVNVAGFLIDRHQLRGTGQGERAQQALRRGVDERHLVRGGRPHDPEIMYRVVANRIRRPTDGELFGDLQTRGVDDGDIAGGIRCIDDVRILGQGNRLDFRDARDAASELSRPDVDDLQGSDAAMRDVEPPVSGIDG